MELEAENRPLMPIEAEDILIIILLIMSVRVIAHGRKKRENRVHHIDTCPGENPLLILVIDFIKYFYYN